MEMHTAVEIDRPAEAAFAVVSNFSRNPEWQRGMKTAAWTSDPPTRVGSTYDQTARFLWKDIVTSFEVVAFEPGRSITIESRSSTFPIQVTRSVEPLGPDRCRVAADVSGQPGRLFRLAAPLVGWLAKRSVEGDYRRLKSLLETGDGS